MAQAASISAIGTKRKSWELAVGRSRCQGWEDSGGEAGKGVHRGIIWGTVPSLDENQVGDSERRAGCRGIARGEMGTPRGGCQVLA